MATNVDITDGYAIRNRIQGWTRDRDNTYSMIVLLGTWVELSNVPIPGALTKADGTAYIVGVDYPIPIRSNTRVEPLSHATYFDNQPLSWTLNIEKEKDEAE